MKDAHAIQPPSEPREELTGSVEAVTYHNDTTGYTVCSVRPEGAPANTGPVTVVGKCAAIWVGEELRASGAWRRHPQHGVQFEARSLLCIAPTSLEGIRRYLSSGMIRGIGKVNARRIVDHFGEATLDVIEKQSARLREVEGIGPKRRQLIKESWNEQRGVRDIMIFLQSQGVGTGQAARIFRVYGQDSIALVKQNPFRLCRDVWGIGFKTADAIAQRVGVPRDSPLRARAGLLYTLEVGAEEGHCFALQAELLLQAQALLDIPVERLAEALVQEIDAGSLVREGERVYLRRLQEAEVRVSSALTRLLEAPAAFAPIDVEKALAWVSSRIGIDLAPSQREALRMALRVKVSLITGGPGVGKTTLIRALVDIFAVRKLRIRLAAPTGRAARRMTEATGREAQTLHRLLRYNPQLRHFEHNAGNPLDADVVILDESSMLDLPLAADVLAALPASAHLVLVGDTDQLPSVGPGSVLHDLIRSRTISNTRLETIFRQRSGGQIVRNAHRVNHGEPLETARPGEETDFFFIPCEDSEAILERVVELVQRRIPNKFGLTPLTDIQVLTPMRRNVLGSDNLNRVLQDALNPTGPALQRFGRLYRAGDRVMQLRNNYDKDVFNGDVGWISALHLEAQALEVTFDGRVVGYDIGDLDELTHAFAGSIHKAQGSEYPAVVIVLATQHFKLLQRNLLYTALTRGKRLACLVGSHKAVHLAIRNNDIRERRTALAERLQTASTRGPAAAPPPPPPHPPAPAPVATPGPTAGAHHGQGPV